MTLKNVCDTSFLRNIAGPITPELIARIGIKWHGAGNKPAAASVMRNIVLAEDLQGLAEHYDEYAKNSTKEELKVLRRILRSGQHAARQHREKTAGLVEELFKQTPSENGPLRFVKETVFGVADGAPIMDKDTHPVFDAMFEEYDGTARRRASSWLCTLILCAQATQTMTSSRAVPLMFPCWTNAPVLHRRHS